MNILSYFVVCIFLICSLLFTGEAQQYGLKVITDPAGCVGGEVCTTQPIVASTYFQSGEIAYAFQGFAFVNIGSSPTGYEKLSLGAGCNITSCGEVVTSTIAMVNIVNGIATFKNLFFNTAGSGYTLKFTGLTQTHQAFALAYSASFSVAAGPLYKLVMANFIGHSFGGVPFQNNPIVGAADRGGNILTDILFGTVYANLTNNPTHTKLYPLEATKTRIVDGLATFVGLYINEAYFEYQITFSTNIPDVYPVTSKKFSVNVGNASILAIVNGTEPSLTPKIAGEYFKVPPIIQLFDQGGNWVKTDYQSAIRISIQDNPSNGQFSPQKNLFVQAKQGIIRFHGIKIDRYGLNYTLKFDLFHFIPSTFTFIPTGVSLVSEKFNVHIGPPKQAIIASRASGSWAGNQPFYNQPIIHLTDAGNNVLIHDFQSHSVLSIVESLSVKKQIVIDTTLAPLTQLEHVYINQDSGTYGAGQVLVIILESRYNMWVQVNESSQFPFLPYILLNIQETGTNESRKAEFIEDDYYLQSQPSRYLRFQYTIQDNDFMLPHVELFNPNALILRNTSIVDGNNNQINSTIPIETLNSVIHVNTHSPIISSLSVNVPDGVYGPGDIIDFMVEFDQPVIVYGLPYLLLSVNNNTNITMDKAVFSEISDDNTLLHFLYEVPFYLNYEQIGPLNLAIPQIICKNYTFNESYAAVKNVSLTDHNLTYHYGYRTVELKGGWIRRYSDWPITQAEYNFTQSVLSQFHANHHLLIDHVRPRIDLSYGLQTTLTAGTYYPGEEIYLYLKFDKPVQASGVGIELWLDVGQYSPALPTPFGKAHFTRQFNDNLTLEFLYVVEENVHIAQLNILPVTDALRIVSNESYIRRSSTLLIQNANFSTSGLNNCPASLPLSTPIQLSSIVPQVSAIAVVQTNPPAAKELYPDDSIIIEVQFTSPVMATCPPVLVLDFPYYRESSYLSGNGTSSFFFQYQIQIGDSSNHSIAYRSSPNALCVATGCPQKRNFCNFYANASRPGLIANARADPALRVIGNQTIFPTNPSRDTVVVDVKIREDPGEYGVGTVFHFDVTFSDIVVIPTLPLSKAPSLWLNINKIAVYSAGNFGKILTFTYVTDQTDILTASDLQAELYQSSNSALFCTNGCSLVNQAGAAVDTTMDPLTQFIASGITIDPTPPKITSCIIDSPAHFNFTSGQVIRFLVTTSKPVIVGGLAPKIRLRFLEGKVGDAMYIPNLSNTTELVFLYKLQPNDRLRNFTIINHSVDLNGGFSEIFRLSTIPSVPLNVTIPTPHIFLKYEDEKKFEIGQRSHISDVKTLTPFHRTLGGDPYYSVGDTLLFQVNFTQYVIASGYSYLQLDLGNGKVGNATYFAYIDRFSNQWVETDYITPSAQTTTLIYSYEVQENDFTLALDYVDITSLIIGQNTIHLSGYIKTFSDDLGIDADLNLPIPGSSNSISGKGSLKIDGRAPYLVDMQLLNDPATYSINTTIEILLSFSRPVVVQNGIPSILLETGKVKQQAFYQAGSGTTDLLFRYLPEPGDFTPHLDYYGDRKHFLSANGSFLYNGAEILGLSQKPTIPAKIWLNPPGGKLIGNLVLPSDGGVFEYTDAQLSNRGPDYLLQYEVFPANENYSLTNSQFIYHSFSSEYQLRPEKALEEEQIGSSVDIQGDIAVIGAPNFNVSITTIQEVKISVHPHLPTREVQLISTSIQPQPSIQSFYTTADVLATVGGYFQIRIPSIGNTRPIPASVDAGTLRSFIQFDLPTIGSVSVTAEPYLYCSCYNAYKWTITFLERNIGTFDPIELIGTQLTGTGVSITDPEIIQRPSRLSGFFTVSALNKTSTSIPFDADVQEITGAIEDLGLSIYAVSTSMPDKDTLTRTWSVTFNAYQFSYEMPTLVPDPTPLSGGLNPSVYVAVAQKGYHGPLGIAGYFQLEFRGNITTHLHPNATADEVKYALEALPIINYVNVNRTIVNPQLQTYAWTIELVDFNYHTSRGYFREYRQLNAEPLIPHNHLIATDSDIHVATKYHFTDENTIDSPARQGTFGQGAGAVFVYQRVNESWVEVATLRGNDTVENNRFGGSVSIDSNVILIGAAGANMNGLPEKQAIHCVADNGTFQLSFRGWTTKPIYYNTTREGLMSSIVSPSDVFAKLYSITHITIDDWGTGGLCDNNTAVITFYRPVDGAINVLGVDNGPDLELLTITNNNLQRLHGVPALLNVTEVQKGTWKLHGNFSDPQQIGAAYIFRLQDLCDSPSYMNCFKTTWKQEAQLFPLISRKFSLYGQVVVLDQGVAVVGAPGSNLESGYVYVYEYDVATSTWPLLQILLDPTVSAGSGFGSAMAKSGNTIVISAPNYLDNTGGVFAYTRPPTGGVFVFAQILVPSKAFPIPTQSFYGQSVGIYGNIIAAGASGYPDKKSIFLGSTYATSSRTSSGAVFLFRRPTSNGLINFYQKLTPTNVRDNDHFGYAMKMYEDSLVVSSMGTYTEIGKPAKPVISCITSAAYGHTPLGGYFQLSWRGANQSSSSFSPSFTTRPIRYDTSATQLKYILEEDLQTDKIFVSRSRVDVYDGGYQWDITFLRYRRDIDNFLGDASMLTGTNATVSCSLVNPTPRKVRSIVHLFQYNGSSDTFDEQLYLTPYRYQSNDLCGKSVSISELYAIVGCPNRDQDVPDQHSGTAMIYDLNIMSLAYISTNTTIKEGESVSINVTRDYSYPSNDGRDILYYQQTLDRNANLSVQNFFADHYQLENDGSPEILRTILDDIGISGKAIARSQYYGSEVRTSRWVDGRYDYYGLADYEQVLQPQSFLSEEYENGLQVNTNNDSLVEYPNEVIRMVISSPGLWPSNIGKFYHPIHLHDYSSGYVGGKERYKKILLLEAKAASNEKFGSVTAFNDSYGVMFISAPYMTVKGLSNVGRILQFDKTNVTWNLESSAIFYSPFPQGTIGGRFGSSMALSISARASKAVLIVGEPFHNRVFSLIAVRNDYDSKSFQYETSFSIPEATTQSHLFGASVAMSGHLLAIGAPGLETVYLYYHFFQNGTSWKWTSPIVIHSSDYDYDVVDGAMLLHRQGFGTSIGLSDRTLVVGAPFANYEKSGTYLVENYDTEGVDIRGVGIGKAYVFYSEPAKYEICINSIQILSKGTFRISFEHLGANYTTKTIPFNATAGFVQERISELPNMEETLVTSHVNYFEVNGNANGGYEYCWDFVFLSQWLDITGFSIDWIPEPNPNRPCVNCTGFNYPSPDPANIPQMSINELNAMSSFNEIAGLNSIDGRKGDRFGSAVAIDQNQIIVGAPYSSSLTMTTWDFENGMLLGWTKSGDAFDFQPTLGDNPRFRSTVNRNGDFPDGPLRTPAAAIDSHQYRASTSNLKGLYYVSTFEKHPGSANNYLIPDSSYPAGNSQGNAPKGSLSSDIFMILGDWISFYIGGGCDLFSVYVELLIDGKSIAKQTGKCSDEMELVYFNVSRVRNRAAQLRIVDNSSLPWGYISVDHFSFDWDIRGATVASSTDYPNNNAHVILGKTETPLSGAAYLFKRVLSINADGNSYQSNGKDVFPCPKESQESCAWIYESKLLPSDKRESMQFGSQVAVHDASGIAIVSAPYAPLTSFYKDTPTTYPYYQSNYNVTTYRSTAAGLDYPLDPALKNLFESFPYFTLQSSAGYGVWQTMENQQLFPNLAYSQNIGAVYVFTRHFPIFGHTGEFARNESWKITEKAKIQPIDGQSGDLFGSSLAFDGQMVVIGSPGHHATAASFAGAVYYYRTEFAGLKFSQNVFPVLEGVEKFVTVTVLRDLNVYDGDVILEYATSDVTGRGVDKKYFDYCLSLPTSERATIGCGDYEQTVGHMVIPKGVSSGGFIVRIMDDLCYSPFMKFVQVTLSVPGSGPLQGEELETMIRIDDNDFGSANPCQGEFVPLLNTMDYIP